VRLQFGRPVQDILAPLTNSVPCTLDHGWMWLASLICSDPGCYEERELLVESLEELDGVVCECGYGFVLLAVSDANRAAA
jgi:hypothetical protein